MQLGAQSISLAVQDIVASQEFYAKLGFIEVGGDAAQNWLILRNGEHTVGLFQGMFESNIMTFNPGWDAQAQTVENFTDVREIQARLRGLGVVIDVEADAASSGPASIMLRDPDGNVIMFDQHV